MTESTNTNSPKMLQIAILVLFVAIAIFAGYTLGKNENSENTNSQSENAVQDSREDRNDAEESENTIQIVEEENSLPTTTNIENNSSTNNDEAESVVLDTYTGQTIEFDVTNSPLNQNSTLIYTIQIENGDVIFQSESFMFDNNSLRVSTSGMATFEVFVSSFEYDPNQAPLVATLAEVSTNASGNTIYKYLTSKTIVK